jgi:single-stranded DNA-binding protein
LATTNVSKTRDGQLESKTEWFAVTARGKQLVDSLEKSCKKGNMVFVEGPIVIRNSPDPNTGAERKSVGVILQNFSNYRVLKWAQPRDGEAPAENGGRRGVFGSEGQVYD